MTLDIYREVSTGVYAPHHVDGSSDDLLPIVTTHDGVLGEVVEKKLFVRNNDSTVYYTNITVVPFCKTSPSDITGVDTGHGVKLREGSTQPTEAEWTALDYASSISLDDIGSSGAGDTSSYLPFWARFEVPSSSPADNKENIVLRVSYTANAA